jgi:hypothetical protein
MSLLTRFVNVFRARALEQKIDEELRFHLDQRVADYRQQGMSDEQAETAALARFGTLAAIRDQVQGIDMMNRSFIAGLAVGMLAVSIPAGMLWRGHTHAPVVAPVILRVASPTIFSRRAFGTPRMVKIQCGNDLMVAVSASFTSSSRSAPEIAPPKGCTLISPTQ